jgi:hypothetical protein
MGRAASAAVGKTFASGQERPRARNCLFKTIADHRISYDDSQCEHDNENPLASAALPDKPERADEEQRLKKRIATKEWKHGMEKSVAKLFVREPKRGNIQ